MKNILLVNGNPKQISFSDQLSNAYENEAQKSGNVRRFNLSDMSFDANLMDGYDNGQPLEACLSEFQEAILWANHIVIVSPIWWGGVPAKLKGLIDRTFLPGFSFKFENDNPDPIKLLEGKTSRLILTMDAPDCFSREQAQPVLEQLDQFTLQYCGVSKAAVNLFGSVILSDELQREQWLQTVKAHGANCD